MFYAMHVSGIATLNGPQMLRQENVEYEQLAAFVATTQLSASYWRSNEMEGYMWLQNVIDDHMWLYGWYNYVVIMEDVYVIQGIDSIQNQNAQT